MPVRILAVASKFLLCEYLISVDESVRARAATRVVWVRWTRVDADLKC